jgi:hypothetical protein
MSKQQYGDYGWERLPSGVLRLELLVDEHDHRVISDAIDRRACMILPDATRDDVSMAGRLVAEICRGWLELERGDE